MKKGLSFMLLALINYFNSQVVISSDAIQSNTHLAGIDHNILFNATTRYSVTCNNASFPIAKLFDGSFEVFYANPVPTSNTPFIVTIENLPNVHIQVGAWIGWTTRYGRPRRFKIEGYNVHPVNGYGIVNGWATIVDYSSTDYPSNSDFVFRIPSNGGGSFTKLRYTIYETDSPNFMGLSELFFIHPEATTPYDGLFVAQNNPQVNLWNFNGNNIYSNLAGNVGIGSMNPDSKLTVKGKIHAEEVKIDLQVPADYVFQKYYNGISDLKNDYKMLSLDEVEEFTKKHHHLPNFSSSKEIIENGLELGTTTNKLLEKIEELTLYSIDLNKKNKEQEALIKSQTDILKSLNKRLEKIEKTKQK